MEVDEDKILPSFDTHRHEAVLGAIKIANSVEIGRSLQRSVGTVSPAVIWAAEICGVACRFCDHGCGVMPADVIKGAQHAVCAAHNDERFIIEICGKKFARFRNLICAADRLPPAVKDCASLQFRDTRIGIPRCGNSMGVRKRCAGVIAVNDLF